MKIRKLYNVGYVRLLISSRLVELKDQKIKAAQIALSLEPTKLSGLKSVIQLSLFTEDEAPLYNGLPRIHYLREVQDCRELIHNYSCKLMTLDKLVNTTENIVELSAFEIRDLL